MYSVLIHSHFARNLVFCFVSDLVCTTIAPQTQIEWLNRDPSMTASQKFLMLFTYAGKILAGQEYEQTLRQASFFTLCFPPPRPTHGGKALVGLVRHWHQNCLAVFYKALPPLPPSAGSK